MLDSETTMATNKLVKGGYILVKRHEVLALFSLGMYTYVSAKGRRKDIPAIATTMMVLNVTTVPPRTAVRNMSRNFGIEN